MCDFQGNMVQAMVLIIQVTDLMAAMDLMDRMLLPIAGPTEVLSFFFECLKLTGIVDGTCLVIMKVVLVHPTRFRHFNFCT